MGMEIGMIGGTGPAGLALAARLAASGVKVAVGSRSAERAGEVVGQLLAQRPDVELPLVGVANEDAVDHDVVILATPWEASVETVLALRSALEGRVLISMVNAIAKSGRELQALVPIRGSMASTLQAVLPATKVSIAFQHLPAKRLAAIEEPVEGDVFVCADDEEAIEPTVGVVATFQPLSAA